MDWLDKIFNNIKLDFKNKSLKRSMGYYILFATLIVSICYAITYVWCENWKMLIIEKYNLITNNLFITVYGLIETPITIQEKGNNLFWYVDLFERISVFLYAVIAILISSYAYFKNKLKEPLHLLHEEAGCISRDDLSFSCSYNSKDEMGEICKAFDNMRIQLIINKKNMWELMEEQRQLNAAFAHDLRTPLTVMKGYIEMITTYYPQGKLSDAKMLDTLRMLQIQVENLENFSNTMKNIQTFEKMEVYKSSCDIWDLYKKIEESVEGIRNCSNQKINLSNKINDNSIAYYDIQLIMEVFDNMISNAIRYANKNVDVLFETTENKLYLYVKDDGKGFSDDELEKASRPYYTGENDKNHYGIGLTICKILCEKHGGSLELSNSITGGAIICAVFFIS